MAFRCRTLLRTFPNPLKAFMLGQFHWVCPKAASDERARWQSSSMTICAICSLVTAIFFYQQFSEVHNLQIFTTTLHPSTSCVAACEVVSRTAVGFVAHR